MNKKHIFILLFGAPLFGIFLAGIKVYYSIQVWKYQGPDFQFQIKPGESFGRINYRLKESELINSSKLFHKYSQVYGLMTKFKAGNYIIKKDSNMVQIIKTLTEGKSITISVTIPEGKNLFEIAKILEQKKITNEKDFIKFAKDPDFTSSLGIPASRTEGYLYPDTYRFTEATPAKSVIKTMVNTFNRKTKEIDFSRGKFSKHSVVILASIVEKETGASFERPRISGVFHNRLKKRMRLQSDPTTIYGIYENYNGNLRKKHLLQKTAYNTYKISGLPKGPISNPGIEAMKAALSPENHNFLYFVSKNDGTHIFSKNYKDHRKAVQEYQVSRKKRVGKSWRDLKQKSK